jgi:hypothetical protein
MAHDNGLSQWMQVVSTQLPHLSRAQAEQLAAYSYGMVMTGHCGQSIICNYLAELEHERECAVRQRLREWCYAAQDKRGRQRQAVQVQQCFAPLLHWVLDWWTPGPQQLVLVCDATTLRQTFTVLAISLVYRGCALPLAWVIVSATAPGTWQEHWLDLLDLLAPAVPADWQVLVLTDRGLYAKWLFLGIVAHGWHPVMRINATALFQRCARSPWRRLASLVAHNGCVWAHEVVCFRTPRSQLHCTLLACWSRAYATPWLIVTDLPPARAQITWYRMRAWIEGGFKDYKRGGWRWEQTKMTRPERAERLWLVMAVASLWVLSVGGAADARRSSGITAAEYTRTLSCFTLGLNAIHVAIHRDAPLPHGRFVPELLTIPAQP